MNHVKTTKDIKMWIFDKLKGVSRRIRGPHYEARQRLKYEFEHGEPEIKLISLIGTHDTLFLDVGANNGVYAYYALPYFGKVLAVEAHPDLIGPLRLIIEPKGKVLATALSDREGVAELWIPLRENRDVTTRSSLEAEANPGLELRQVEVLTSTVDSLKLDRVGLLKIDVEGHELAVLRGARGTLQKQKPLCIVECEERHNQGGVAQAFDFFGELGYRAYFLHRGRLRDGNEFDPKLLQSSSQAKKIDEGRSPDYINNFIFIHPLNSGALDRIRELYKNN